MKFNIPEIPEEDTKNPTNLTVILNVKGRVITVSYGEINQ